MRRSTAFVPASPSLRPHLFKAHPYPPLFHSQQQGVIIPPHEKGNASRCPHAHLAARAVAQADAISASRVIKGKRAIQGGFDYESFYNVELDKKHKDK